MPTRRSLPFLSPLTKLVIFFHRSRDKWKEKCKAAKRQNKSLKLCLAKMKESRDRWKVQARCSGKSPQMETTPAEEETTKNRAQRRPRRRHARLGVGAAG